MQLIWSVPLRIPLEPKVYTESEIADIMQETLDELIKETGSDIEYNGCPDFMDRVIKKLQI